MFGKLKEKLKSWTQSLTKHEKKEEVKEKKPEKIVETREYKKEAKPEHKKELKEIEVPTKFEAGTMKVEPDTEKIKEIEKNLEETSEAPEEGFFSKLKSKVTKIKISDNDFEQYKEDLRMLLLENNVAYEVADYIIFKLKQKVVGKEILKKELEGEVKDTLREIIESVLIDPFDVAERIIQKEQKPYVILFCGINGTGKTTTIAKLIHYFKKQGLSSVIAAADTFRAASIEQLKTHGEKLGVKVVAHDYGSDPAAVGFDAIKYAQKNKIDVVLIDTAGRMHTEKNLIKEMEKISKVNKPDLKIFVGEAITGNDAIEQIRTFDEAIGIDGIILTKADTDEKGGTSLSVGHVTRKPILYLGIGQKYNDLIPFDKRKFTKELGL